MKPTVDKEAVFYLPFIKEGQEYEIKYIYQYDGGPWTEVTGKITALETGLDLDDYFEYDEALKASKIVCSSDSYTIKLNTNLSSKIKESVESAVFDGGFVVGDVNWNNATWIRSVKFGLKNSNEADPSDYCIHLSFF